MATAARRTGAEPGLAAIAEIKRRSPSAGDLRLDADPGEAGGDVRALRRSRRVGARRRALRWHGSPTCEPHVRLPVCPCSPRGSSRQRTSWSLSARRAPMRSCCCCATSTTRPPPGCRRARTTWGWTRSSRHTTATSLPAPSRSARTRSASTPATWRRSASTGARSSSWSPLRRATGRSSPRAASRRACTPCRPSSPAPTRSSSAPRSCAPPIPARRSRRSFRDRW